MKSQDQIFLCFLVQRSIAETPPVNLDFKQVFTAIETYRGFFHYLRKVHNIHTVLMCREIFRNHSIISATYRKWLFPFQANKQSISEAINQPMSLPFNRPSRQFVPVYYRVCLFVSLWRLVYPLNCSSSPRTPCCRTLCRGAQTLNFYSCWCYTSNSVRDYA